MTVKNAAFAKTVATSVARAGGRASRRKYFPAKFFKIPKKKDFFFFLFFRPDNNDVRKSGKRWFTIALRTSLRYLKDASGGNNNILDIKTKNDHFQKVCTYSGRWQHLQNG